MDNPVQYLDSAVLYGMVCIVVKPTLFKRLPLPNYNTHGKNKDCTFQPASCRARFTESSHIFPPTTPQYRKRRTVYATPTQPPKRIHGKTGPKHQARNSSVTQCRSTTLPSAKLSFSVRTIIAA